MRRLLLLFVLNLTCWSQEAHWSVTASAMTPRTGPFPVRVSIVVVNHTRRPTPEATVVLEMTPRISPGTRPTTGGPHIWDPVTLQEDLPELQPGQQHKLVLVTPYFAATQQIDRQKSFPANNLGPTITTQTQVDFRVRVNPVKE